MAIFVTVAVVPGRSFLGQTEIEDLQSPVRRDADVAGLEITVNDAGIVRGGKPLRELLAQLEDRFLWKGAGLDLVAERHARHELHDQQVEAVRGVEVVNARDVRVTQPGQGHGLVSKPRPGFRVFKGRGRQDLDGDVAIEAVVERPVDDAHATGAEFLDDAVTPKGAADHQGSWTARTIP